MFRLSFTSAQNIQSISLELMSVTLATCGTGKTEVLGVRVVNAECNVAILVEVNNIKSYNNYTSYNSKVSFSIS